MPITDPTDLADLLLWLDATQESMVDGQAVSTWADRSGNANHATQGTAARQPRYDADAFAPLPGIYFDGGDHLQLPGGIFDIGHGTSLLVGRFDVGAGSDSRWMLASTDICTGCGSGGTSLNRRRWYFGTVPTQGVTISVGGSGFNNTGMSSEQFGQLVGTDLVLAQRTDGTTGTALVACVGEQTYAFVDGPYSGAAGDLGGEHFQTIGAYGDGSVPGTPTQHMVGPIGEIVHYDRALTDTELDDLVLYAQQKWDVLCGGGWQVGAVGVG